MNVKRLLIPILLALSLIVCAVPSSSASVTPGSKCSKAGAKKTFKGKVFTCIKLGSKLYWNNGVIAVKADTKVPTVPANCNLLDQKSVSIISQVDKKGQLSGLVLYTGKLQNLSPVNMATDVIVYFDWFDSLGQYNREKITIPRLLPGQVLEFGHTGYWNNSSRLVRDKRPDYIEMKSSCKSQAFTQKKVLLSGKGVVKPESGIIDELDGVVTIQWELNSEILLSNTFDRALYCRDQSGCNFGLYVVFKDSFGNVIAGSMDQGLYNAEIEPGDSGILSSGFAFYFDNLPVDQLLSRITRYEYTLVPNF
jgi:hypothetical protein